LGLGKIIAENYSNSFENIILRTRNEIVIKTFSKYYKPTYLFTEEKIIKWYLLEKN